MIRAIADGVALVGFVAALAGVAGYLGSPVPVSVSRIVPYAIAAFAVAGAATTVGHLALPWFGRAPTAMWGWLQIGLAIAIVAAWLGWNLDFLGSAGKFG